MLLTAIGPDEEKRWRLVHRIHDLIAETRPTGVHGAIATYDSVLVEFDCTTTSQDLVLAAIAATQEQSEPAETRDRRRFSVPVVYGGKHGPDLHDVALELGLPEARVISAHADNPHIIRCVVSPPGTPMTDLQTLPQTIPRRRAPRASIPAGSVAVAGRQAVIYATSSPGGWRLIGRTPARLFDPTANPPVPYAPGDVLEFYPIQPGEWSSHLARPANSGGG
jgi:KipI family sensor histidine kinase inhibitor